MAKTLFLEWPTTQKSYEVVTKLTPEGQLRVAKERAAAALELATKDHPGETVTVGFAFAGFVPCDTSKVETV
jgi:hypothetical protein